VRNQRGVCQWQRKIVFFAKDRERSIVVVAEGMAKMMTVIPATHVRGQASKTARRVMGLGKLMMMMMSN
jgi:hypothetical protein